MSKTSLWWRICLRVLIVTITAVVVLLIFGLRGTELLQSAIIVIIVVLLALFCQYLWQQRKAK